MLDMTTASSLLRRRIQVRGWIGSSVIHGLALLMIVASQRWIESTTSAERRSNDQPLVMQSGLPLDSRRPFDSRFATTAELPESEPTRDVFGEWVEFDVQRVVARSQQHSTDELLAQLRQRTSELNRASSAESLDVLAGQLRTWLGTAERATRPADEAVEGPFEFASAQMHDVRREAADDGTYRYHAVLVDAAGRRFETDVDAATGEQLFRVFEIIRGNPLLEKVYRQIVMSLLDKAGK